MIINEDEKKFYIKSRKNRKSRENMRSTRELVDGILSNININEKIPSERRIGEITGYSRGAVRDYLLKLEGMGFLINRRGKARVLIKKMVIDKQD